MLGTETHHFIWIAFHQEVSGLSSFARKSARQSSQAGTLFPFNLQPVGLPAGSKSCSKKSEVTGSVLWIKENTGARMGSCIYPGRVSPATREEVTKAGSQSSALSHTEGLSSNLVSTLSWLTGFLLLWCQRTVSLSQLQRWANGESAYFKVDSGKLVSLLLSISRYVTDLLSHIWQAQNHSFLLFFPSR